MDIILKYFPDLTDEQYQQFKQLDPLYREWNEQINVISRKDIDKLYLHHVLHSLAIAKWMAFAPHSKVLDLGTGGGFPGIPLAIIYPDVLFHLIDARAKKIKVVQAIAEQLGLNNVKASHGRVEEHNGHYDFIVTRAVAPLARLWQWSGQKIKGQNKSHKPNGIIALKGGDLAEEMSELPGKIDIYTQSISELFDEEYFEGKQLLHLVKTKK